MPDSTRRRFLTAGTLGGIAAVAGCSTDLGGSGPDDPDDGAEDADGTGTDPAATTATGKGSESLEPPDGTSAQGIDDPQVLVDATRQALAENDFDLAQRLAFAVDGEQRSDVTQRKRSSLDDQRRLFVFESSSETNRVYREGDTVYRRSTADGETEYTSGEAREGFEESHPPELLDGTESLGGILETGAYEPTETVERDGRRLLRFELTSADESAFEGTVTAAEATVFVDADSVVHEGRRTVELESDGDRSTIEQSFVIRQLGELSVERPDWYDEAAG